MPYSKLSPALRMSKPSSSEPPIASEAEVLTRQWHVAGWGWTEQFAPSPKVVKELPAFNCALGDTHICKIQATQDDAVVPNPSTL